MTKTEYMRTLAHKLRRLPKEDYDKAMEYFEEYLPRQDPNSSSRQSRISAPPRMPQIS